MGRRNVAPVWASRWMRTSNMLQQGEGKSGQLGAATDDDPSALRARCKQNALRGSVATNLPDAKLSLTPAHFY
jgi:hypothetical protein